MVTDMELCVFRITIRSSNKNHSIVLGSWCYLHAYGGWYEVIFSGDFLPTITKRRRLFRVTCKVQVKSGIIFVERYAEIGSACCKDIISSIIAHSTNWTPILIQRGSLSSSGDLGPAFSAVSRQSNASKSWSWITCNCDKYSSAGTRKGRHANCSYTQLFELLEAHLHLLRSFKQSTSCPWILSRQQYAWACEALDPQLHISPVLLTLHGFLSKIPSQPSRCRVRISCYWSACFRWFRLLHPTDTSPPTFRQR